MSKLPIFKLFLSVGNLTQAKTQVIFQAETQAKIVSIELGPRSHETSHPAAGAAAPHRTYITISRPVPAAAAAPATVSIAKVPHTLYRAATL